jgi:RNA polymerase sigma factor (sigma-70 family)
LLALKQASLALNNIEEIIKGCQKEDAKCQEVLFNRYSRLLFTVCLRYIKDSDDAKDVLQESFIKVFDSIKSYRGEGSFEGWAKRITANTAIHFLKQRKKLSYVYDHIHGLSEDNQEEEKELDTDLDTELIIECLNKLPDGYRIVINLYLMEGYSHAEIGKKLNIKEATSRSQYFKARKYLIKQLSQKTEKITLK